MDPAETGRKQPTGANVGGCNLPAPMWADAGSHKHLHVKGRNAHTEGRQLQQLHTRDWRQFTLCYHHHHHLSLHREGRWGTTNEFTTSFLHFSLFSTALWDLANHRPVHSLLLSSHLFSVCLVFFPLSLCLARWWTEDMTIPLQLLVLAQYDFKTKLSWSLSILLGTKSSWHFLMKYNAHFITLERRAASGQNTKL